MPRPKVYFSFVTCKYSLCLLFSLSFLRGTREKERGASYYDGWALDGGRNRLH